MFRKRRLPCIIWGMVGIYGVFVTLVLILRLTVGEQWQIISRLNNMLHLLMMPALILLPVCLVARRARLSLLMFPACVTFISAYGIMFIPRSISVPENAPKITFLTYNLQAEETLLDPMVQNIRAAQADIVALQEMSGAAASRFEAEFADSYPYRALHPEPNGAYHGRGILSRYPIIEDDAWPVEYPIPVRLQRAEIDINGTPLTLYNMHAPPQYPIFDGPYDVQPRKAQIADLLDMAGEDEGAVVLLGDFNTTDLDENYAHITTQFRDSFREIGWGLGFTNPDWWHDNPRKGPSFIPMYHRIDYVFHNDAFQAVEARVWPSSGGSDHRPLYVVLALST
jgi:vancomycin resistance protein VanJ